MMEWISVKERLPPKDKDFLAWVFFIGQENEGECAQARWHMGEETYWYSLIYKEQGMVWAEVLELENMTHWMSLPEPPKA